MRDHKKDTKEFIVSQPKAPKGLRESQGIDRFNLFNHFDIEKEKGGGLFGLP